MTALKQATCSKAAVRQHQTTCRPDELWLLGSDLCVKFLTYLFQRKQGHTAAYLPRPLQSIP